MREVKFREEIYLDFPGFFLAGTRKIDLDGIEAVVLASEIDTE